MKCCHAGCKRTAEYDSPKLYCQRHWIEWWVNGLTKDRHKRAALKVECKRILASNYGQKRHS